MDWIQGMQSAINYMEDHIREPLSFDDVAKQAGSSTFHFMRMFNILTGFTVGEYVRNRRMTLAGQELAATDARVLDIALKYGYETHESFTKAFVRFHGISPSAARKPRAELKSMGKLSIQVILKGDKPLNYKIIEKEAFTVMGKKTPVTCVGDENFDIVPKFCAQCNQDGTYDLLGKRCIDDMCVMGICAPIDRDNFNYYAAVTYDGGEIPKGMELLEIPASKYAVFESVGPMPGAIQDVFKRVYSEWFPASKYEHAAAPELEVYTDGDMSAPDYKAYVWIPITSCAGGKTRV